MNNKNILYIGNNLVRKTNYSTSMDILSNLLVSEGFIIYKSSSKSNKILRLLDMCIAILWNFRKVNYVLIDTFSTSNFYYALFTSQLCRLCNVKYLPILHGGNLPNRLNQSPKLSRLIFKNSNQNIAPSGYLKYEFEKKGFSTTLIPNTIPIKSYRFKKRLKIKPRLLYVRAFAKIYNPTMAIEVLKEFENLRSKYCSDLHVDYGYSLENLSRGIFDSGLIKNNGFFFSFSFEISITINLFKIPI